MTPFSKLIFAAGLLALPLACSDGYGRIRAQSTLQVTIKDAAVGTRNERLGISVVNSYKFNLRIEAHDRNGNLDESFSGYVRLSTQPGTVRSVTGPGVDGRNVALTNGVVDDVTVELIAAYGDTFIWAEDIGYTPAALENNPKCSDGIDNDGDGLVDFPVDPGCAFANDDTEEDGTFASGSSAPIFFQLPRIADVRGFELGGVSTAFPNEQVRIDTGYRPDQNAFAFHSVVTRIAQDGFFVTDLDDTRGYSSVFAFTFSAPPLLQPCDVLTSLTGTAYDFFGFTELNFPTWTISQWDGKLENCLIPQPTVLESTRLASDASKQNLVSGLVRLYSGVFERKDRAGTVVDTTDTAIRVGTHFGPEHPKSGFPGENASNCDFNEDGRIDFYTEPEKGCSNACDTDIECSEYSEFASRQAFDVIVKDNKNGAETKIQIDGSVAARLSPLALRGKPLKSFTGDLRYFSGGNQYTIVAGCDADIVIEMDKEPDPRACFFRTDANTNEQQ